MGGKFDDFYPKMQRRNILRLEPDKWE